MNREENERQGLLRDVLENPRDDSPRLVMSDWLEDHGETAAADFIRSALKHPRRYQTWFPTNGTLRRSRWGGNSISPTLEKLWGKVPSFHGTWKSRRGWVETITKIDSWDFIRYARDLFQHHPITRVYLGNWTPCQAELIGVEFPPGLPWFWIYLDVKNNRTENPFLGSQNHRLGQLLVSTASGFFPTQRAALEAYSKGLVLWGREQARLKT